jgi:hypothetical protein
MIRCFEDLSYICQNLIDLWLVVGNRQHAMVGWLVGWFWCWLLVLSAIPLQEAVEFAAVPLVVVVVALGLCLHRRIDSRVLGIDRNHAPIVHEHRSNIE